MTPCAAILAGGLGTRLRKVVSDRPKVMAMVAGRPFITYLLDQLLDSGIRKTVLCTGYMADLIRNELGSTYKGMALFYSPESIPLGTGGALRNAVGQASGDMLLVLNGDSFCQCTIADFIAGQNSSGAYAGMVLTRVTDISRFGAVLTNEASRVETFIEKGGLNGPGWINAGIYLLPINMVSQIPPERQVSLEHELFPALIDQGLYGYRCTGSFIDIGIPAELQRAQLFFSEMMKGKP